MITLDNRRWLLCVARQALEDKLRGFATTPPAHTGRQDACGAFVSVHRNGELRACLGRIETTLPLSAVIAELGRAVADSDPRFPPITVGELAEIDVEISVLTPRKEIWSPEEVVVGIHGLIVERGSRRGLLLPQVATEHGWDRRTFVEHTCVKAGLSRNAWQEGARLFVFEAVVFGEKTWPQP